MNAHQSEICKTHILIVDDTPDNVRYLAKMLTAQGYNVRKALNGQMALVSNTLTRYDFTRYYDARDGWL